MRDAAAQILYVGKANNLLKRVSSYFQGKPLHGIKIYALVPLVRHIDYIPTASEREALIVERRLIQQLQPVYNTLWKDDKSFPYLKLTWKEDYPRLFLTRKHLKDGGVYFGPYPNVQRVKGLLRYIWRQRWFPLRPCRYEFSEEKPLAPQKIKQCLYYHTKECPAPCAGRISKPEYRAIAQQVRDFFDGDYRKLIDGWQSEMKSAAKSHHFEQAAQLRDNLQALQHMEQRVTLREIEPQQADLRIERSRALSDLQNALALPKPPIRIECFDISHFQGAETVASMVVFEGGYPLKSDYRKFKIKTVPGIDDFASMREVVGRRYKRLLQEKRSLPDLILIDGGKGQLQAALDALKLLFPKGNHPPIASLAKQEEEIFIPSQSESIRLSHESPSLHVLQHIRDEAHRFAITFHRSRRSKKTFDGLSDRMKSS